MTDARVSPVATVEDTGADTGGGRPVKKVLVIGYRFPPQGGGGVQRTLKFVKYLPQFGWLPVVHTVRNPYWPSRDTTLLSEVPAAVKVYRTLTVEFERLERAAAGLFESEQRRTSAGGAEAAARRGGSLAVALKAVAHLAHRRVLVPDPQVAWIPAAFVRSLHIVSKERVSLIYTSSPPNSCQVLGLLLKRLTKLPWVADFRDPWTEGVRRKESYRGHRMRQRIEEALERSVLSRADHVVATTDKTVEQFVQKYSSVSAAKCSVITNGFDPADFAVIAPGQLGQPPLEPDDFNVTLTGNVESQFDAAPFLRAVKGLIDEDDEIRGRLRVNFVGTRRGKYDEYIRQSGLGGNVRYVEYVPHATSLRYLAASDVLFLCQIPVYESAGTKLPGKLFEYLYMRKPVLALTLPGATSEILTRSGLGTVVGPDDEAGMKKALRQLYVQCKRGGGRPEGDEGYIRRFDRLRQTEHLAQIFDGVVNPVGVRE